MHKKWCTKTYTFASLMQTLHTHQHSGILSSRSSSQVESTILTNVSHNSKGHFSCTYKVCASICPRYAKYNSRCMICLSEIFSGPGKSQESICNRLKRTTIKECLSESFHLQTYLQIDNGFVSLDSLHLTHFVASCVLAEYATQRSTVGERIHKVIQYLLTMVVVHQYRLQNNRKGIRRAEGRDRAHEQHTWMLRSIQFMQDCFVSVYSWRYMTEARTTSALFHSTTLYNWDSFSCHIASWMVGGSITCPEWRIKGMSGFHLPGGGGGGGQ